MEQVTKQCVCEINFVLTEILGILGKVQKQVGGYDERTYGKILESMDKLNQQINPGAAPLQGIGDYSPPADPPKAESLNDMNVNAAPEPVEAVAGGEDKPNETPPPAA